MFAADKLVNTYMTGFMVSIQYSFEDVKRRGGGARRERERKRNKLHNYM
jgi:hypothetical protein